MNYNLCEVLKAKLDGLTIVTNVIGLADTIDKDGVTYPASCDEVKVVPDSNEAVVVYFTDGSYSSDAMYGDIHTANQSVIMHVWANMNLIDNCDSDEVIKSLIQCCNEQIQGYGIVKTNLTSKTIKSEDAFKGYKLATDLDYQSAPYKNWVVNLNYQGVVNESCAKNININNKQC